MGNWTTKKFSAFKGKSLAKYGSCSDRKSFKDFTVKLAKCAPLSLEVA